MLSHARSGLQEPSLLQVQRWAADRLEPGGHHNLALAARCKTVPEPAALQRSLEALAAGHVLLRTTFPGSGGRPALRLEARAVRELSFIELRGTAAHEGDLREQAAELARRPFDVERGPLWRVAVLRTVGDDHLLVAAAHRLIADRDSVRLLLRAVLDSTPAAPRVQGAEGNASIDIEVEKELSRWRTELASLDPTPLPTDYPRPNVSLRRRGREPIAIAPEVVRELDALAASAGVDLATAFAAVVELLLHRYGGRRDVALGFRDRPASPDRFGPLARLLLVRNDVPERGTADDLLRVVAEALTRARAGSALDLETAAEALGVGGRDGGIPVPQVALAVEDAPSTPEPWSELIDIDTGGERGDLFFRLHREGGGVRGYLEYDRDLFEPATAERIRAHFLEASSALARRAALASISLLGPAERASVLAWSNASRVPEPPPEQVAQLFESQVDRAPHQVAVVSLDERLTYGELDARANHLASHLLQCGIGRGAIVGILLERSTDAIVAILGVLKSGAAWLPLDPSFPRERTAAILADAGARLVITDSALETRVCGSADLLRIDVERVRDLRSATRPAPAAGASDLAYVMYTSGSTGTPKGVAVEHRALASYTDAAAETYGIGASDRVLQFASFSFDASIEEIFPTLCRGATLVLRPEWMLDSLGLFLRKVAEWEITVLSLPTAYWHEVARRVGSGEEQLPRSLRLVIIGGEAARADLVAAWIRRVGNTVRLLNTYGPTETTVVATCWDAAAADPELPPRDVPIGKPLPNSSAYVLGPDLQLLPFGVVGELYIGGAAVARGYVGRPELTAERFVPDPFAIGEGRRMYRTGDRCRLLPSGDLEFGGRADDQVKVRGFRVEPGEIEVQLNTHPAIEHAAVVARTPPGGGTRLVAYLVGRDGVDAAEIRSFLRRRLPEFMVPSAIVFLDRLPLTSSGKIDRRALPHAAETEPPRILPARAPMEDLVARAFCETLQLPAVGTRDPFFSVGGSSLAAVQIAATLSERLSLAIDAQDVLETSTVEALAERISARLTGNARRPASREDLLADVLLDPEIRAPAPTAYPAPLDAAGIFLTGATGFFGAFLLRALLERTSGPVRCLVRASDEREARGRLSAAWQRVAGAASSLPERALAVPGDLARPRLGMSAADWDAAAAESDFIFHGGASVSYLLPYRALRGANVLGTEEVLRLAAQKKLKRVHHVSTIDVAAAHGPGAPERDDVAEPEALGNGYAQTKWVAERLAGIAQERGIPVAIYRPGRLVADSRNGVANGNDFLLRLVQASVAAGVLPDFDLQLDMTPVDYASAAMAALAFGGGAGAVFHLVHPHPVPWSLLSRALHDFGYHLRVLPFETWRAALRRSGRRADGDAFALYLAGMEEPRLRAALEALHGCERTVAALAAHGLRCPTIDAALLRVHLAHLVRSGMLPAPG